MSGSRRRATVQWVGATILGCVVVIAVRVIFDSPSAVLGDPITWMLLGFFVILSWIEARRRVNRKKFGESDRELDL